jgi:hypothetical protein
MQLIYYSLARTGNPTYDGQWVQSIRSLRKYNEHTPVCLLAYNDVSDQILRAADCNNVTVYVLGDYREALREIFVHGAVLSFYPTLHKFISLSALDTTEISQILYVDCDTFFFADPCILFEENGEHDWYAREAPTSRRCRHGYNPLNIDEEALDAIVSREGLRAISPFNSGVCLMNHGIWHHLAALRVTFLDNVWRLLVGRHSRPADGSDDHVRAAVLKAATRFDYARAIPYPSQNFWILEEIALWLTLGRVEGMSQGFLNWDQVSQNGEFESPPNDDRWWILSHYFSSMEERFFSTVERLNE